MLSSRVRAVAPSPTLRMSALARRLKSEGRDVLDLSVGEPDFPTPEVARRAAERAIADGRTGYTANEGVIELRRAICRKLERDNGLRYAPEQILVSPGAKASLFLAAQALLDDGDEALVPAPYWVSYPDQIRLAGGVPVVVATHEAEGFRLTPDRLERAVTPRSRLLILNYPCNPTGACYDRGELAALVEVAERHDLWILADEIYERLLYDGRTFTSVAAVSADAPSRTVLVNGLSKAYAMTGWRMGYAAGPAEVVSAMAAVQSHDTGNATSIAQWAAVAALDHAEDAVRAMVSAFERRRDLVLARLGAIPGLTCARPAGAFYVFPGVSAYLGKRAGDRVVATDDDLAVHLLETAGVAVVPGTGFGAPGYVRMSYAASEETLRDALDRFAAALAGLT